MRVVVAPDKFEGSLTAEQAANAIEAGLRRARADVQVVRLPVGDGGAGTLAAVVAAGFERVPVPATGPTGEPVQAAIAVLGDRAFVEMAEASGLRRLPGGRRAPLEATTYGTGELLRAALDLGITEVVLGIGGSATTDGGTGMASALGARFLDEAGERLPPGGAALLAGRRRGRWAGRRRHRLPRCRAAQRHRPGARPDRLPPGRGRRRPGDHR